MAKNPYSLDLTGVVTYEVQGIGFGFRIYSGGISIIDSGAVYGDEEVAYRAGEENVPASGDCYQSQGDG